jgi:hypothetical protein
MTDYTPTVYRITRKMAEKVVPLLNDKDVYVEDIQRHLNKDALKRVAGITNLKGISGVYVGEDRKAGTGHNILPYSDEYQRTWGNQFVYGNVIIIFGDKAYNELPAELKTTDINTITL